MFLRVCYWLSTILSNVCSFWYVCTWLTMDVYKVWRLFTNFFFFGQFSLDFVFHMYFLIRYARSLEEGSFRGRTADFAYMLIIGATLMTFIAPFVSIHFLGSSLSFMMIYIWGRRNRNVRMNLLGLFPFTASYLAYVRMSPYFSLSLSLPPYFNFMSLFPSFNFFCICYLSLILYFFLFFIQLFRWLIWCDLCVNIQRFSSSSVWLSVRTWKPMHWGLLLDTSTTTLRMFGLISPE